MCKPACNPGIYCFGFHMCRSNKWLLYSFSNPLDMTERTIVRSTLPVDEPQRASVFEKCTSILQQQKRRRVNAPPLAGYTLLFAPLFRALAALRFACMLLINFHINVHNQGNPAKLTITACPKPLRESSHGLLRPLSGLSLNLYVPHSNIR